METISQELNDFFKELEETKNTIKELSEFNTLLQEELRIARNAERDAETKKARCQAFLNQQQEIIQKLLAVKEENENLKCKLTQTEKSLSMVQSNSIEEQIKKDEQIQEIEQECLKKIIKAQEDANELVEAAKTEYLEKIDELRSSLSKLEEQLEEKEATNLSLREENQSLKAWADSNIEAFHKKLTEQERKHQSELETWKMAELNRTVFEQDQQQSSFTMGEMGQNYQQYQLPQALRPIQGYQPEVRFQENTGYQRIPLVTHKNVPPRHNTNMVRPLSTPGNYQNKSHFLSANEVYRQNFMSASSNREETGESSRASVKENIKPKVTQKPKVLVPNKKRKLFNNNQNLL